MAVETRILSDIEHPNIIKMRACGLISPFEVDYFIGKTYSIAEQCAIIVMKGNLISVSPCSHHSHGQIVRYFGESHHKVGEIAVTYHLGLWKEDS